MASSTSVQPQSPPPPPAHGGQQQEEQQQQQQQQQPQQEQTCSSDTTPAGSPPTTSAFPTPDLEKAEHSDGFLGPPAHAGDLALARKATTAERIRRTLTVQPGGESGRSGIHPLPFLRITFRSTSWASRIVNVLWPVVPAAIAVRYATPHNHLVIFVLSYLAMVPCANLVGFAGQELTRKLPHVLGIIIATT